jgi:DNA-binding XRE family transcriptional regulator
METDKSNPYLANTYKLASVLNKKVEEIWPNKVKIKTTNITKKVRKVVAHE